MFPLSYCPNVASNLNILVCLLRFLNLNLVALCFLNLFFFTLMFCFSFSLSRYCFLFSFFFSFRPSLPPRHTPLLFPSLSFLSGPIFFFHSLTVNLTMLLYAMSTFSSQHKVALEVSSMIPILNDSQYTAPARYSFLGFFLISPDTYGIALPRYPATTLTLDLTPPRSFFISLSGMIFLFTKGYVLYYFGPLLFLSSNTTSTLFSHTCIPFFCSQPHCRGVDSHITMNDLSFFGFCELLYPHTCCCPWLALFHFHVIWLISLFWTGTSLPCTSLCASSSI